MNDENREVSFGGVPWSMLPPILASEIASSMRSEFSEKHLTGNLVDTMKKSDSLLEIPAPRYSFKKFFLEHAIIPIGGSYASDLDESGSRFIIWWEASSGTYKDGTPKPTREKYKKVEPKNHIGYVRNRVMEACARFCGKYFPDYEVEMKWEE